MATGNESAGKTPDDEDKALAQLLEGVATKLLPILIELVLHTLPGVELARLACVHKAFWVALKSLRQQHPGPRYASPTALDIEDVKGRTRFMRATAFGDVVALHAMLTEGVDSDGSLLLRVHGG